jgi:hypothetical protein
MSEMMAPPEPATQHRWLEQLVGEWSFEGECPAGPDKPAEKVSGTETYRKLGDLWVVGEGEGDAPGGVPTSSMITLGFDPAKDAFVGSVVCSMMNYLWIYTGGSLDADGKALTLECVGPNFIANDGSMTEFQDIFTFESPTHRTLTAMMKMADGEWIQLMQNHYHRK